MTSNSEKRQLRLRTRLPLWAFGSIAIIGLIILTGTSIWLFQTVRSMSSTLEVSNPEFGSVNDPTRVASIVLEGGSGQVPSNPQPLISADSVDRWSGNERISILLLGIDQRCEEGGPAHTDTMMVLTVDPVGLSAAVLSLPRDLWVEIPGFGVDRINQANYIGEINEYPGGGPGLAMETVAATLGTPIDYYVAINFDAFIDAVDLVDGIIVDVPEGIDDPTYPDRCYGYDPFSIESGVQKLDGETALKYARTRATFGGDVDRAGRQQIVIMALRDQIMSLEKLPQLITRSLQIWQTFQDSVRTNLSFEETLQLGLLVQEIPRGSIQTAVIDFEFVYNETTPDGRQVLVPNREKIRELRDALFTPPAIPTPVIENLPALMASEEAKVAVYNGTPVFGLAAETQEYLLKFNIDVKEIGNADSSTYRTTQIIDYGSHNNTTQYLTQLLNVPPLNISTGTNPEGEFDVLIILGNDWEVPGS